MVKSIFCPKDHLILAGHVCPECGWKRLESGAIGEPLWGPIDIGSGMGQAGSHAHLGWALLDHELVFPINSGGCVVLSKATGEILWQMPMEPGRVIRDLVPYQGKLLASVNDERDMLNAEKAQLIEIDIQNHRLRMLWEAEAPIMSTPAAHGRYVVIRDVQKGLVFLDSADLSQELDTLPLQEFSHQPPLVIGDHIIISDGIVVRGGVWLKAFDINTRKLVWESETFGNLVATPLVFKSRYLIISPDRRTLMMLDFHGESGVQWRIPLKRIYTPPVVLGEDIAFVARGADDPQAEDHYLFTRLDPISGDILSQVPVRKKVERALVLSDTKMVFSGRDRHYQSYVVCVDLINHNVSWAYQFDRESDPIQVPLKADERCVYTASIKGRVVALQHDLSSDEAKMDPEKALADGENAAAAAGFALAGDFRQAAEIYWQVLRQPEKALQLFEHAGLYEEAGELAKQNGWYKRALDYFEKAGAEISEAEVYEVMGDKIEAAKRYEALGLSLQAGRLFEEVDEVEAAFRTYKKSGDRPSIRQILAKINTRSQDTQFTLDVIEECLRIGDLTRAAGLYDQIGHLEQAAKTYQAMGADEKELDVLIRLMAGENVGFWVFERVAELGEEHQRFDLAAKAHQRLNHLKQAGEAYQKAGDMVLASGGETEEAAAYFEKAQICFESYGLIEKFAPLRRKIIECRQLPDIDVKVIFPQKPLQEDEMHYITLSIKNSGYSTAESVTILAKGTAFSFMSGHNPVKVHNLAPQTSIERNIFLKPHDHGFLPLNFEWSWHGGAQKAFQMVMTGQFPVQSMHDSQPFTDENGYVPYDVFDPRTTSKLRQSEGDLAQLDDLGVAMVTQQHEETKRHDVFVSYSKTDRTVADAIVANLEASKIRCWYAPRDVLPGVEWARAIVRGIMGSRIMVVVFSASSNNSTHVVRECDLAIKKNVIIVPFRIENVLPTESMEYYLSTEHWLDAFTPPLQKHIEALNKTIGRLLQE